MQYDLHWRMVREPLHSRVFHECLQWHASFACFKSRINQPQKQIYMLQFIEVLFLATVEMRYIMFKARAQPTH